MPDGVEARRSYGVLYLSRGALLPAAPTLPQLEVDRLPLATPGVTTLPGDNWQVEVSWAAAPQCFTAQPAGLAQYVPGTAESEGLHLRRVQLGERMQPFGMTGSKKIHDIMIDRKVARRLRAGMPLLVSGETVLWLPGVCVDEAARVTQNANPALLVSFSRLAE